jgi:hypothetical protein
MPRCPRRHPRRHSPAARQRGRAHSRGRRRWSGWLGRGGVSHSCACIGSPCLSYCVHGASIGSWAGCVLWAASTLGWPAPDMGAPPPSAPDDSDGGGAEEAQVGVPVPVPEGEAVARPAGCSVPQRACGAQGGGSVAPEAAALPPTVAPRWFGAQPLPHSRGALVAGGAAACDGAARGARLRGARPPASSRTPCTHATPQLSALRCMEVK